MNTQNNATIQQMNNVVLQIPNSSVVCSLKKISAGLNKYLNITNTFNPVNISNNQGFQSVYVSFYRMHKNRFPNQPQSLTAYFSYLQAGKNSVPTLTATLNYLQRHTNRIETSFASKLLHTLNPNLPILDRKSVGVFNKIGLKMPTGSIPSAVNLYNLFEQWYQQFIPSQLGQRWISMFNQAYPHAVGISDLKKIDFILWKI